MQSCAPPGNEFETSGTVAERELNVLQIEKTPAN